MGTSPFCCFLPSAHDIAFLTKFCSSYYSFRVWKGTFWLVFSWPNEYSSANLAFDRLQQPQWVLFSNIPENGSSELKPLQGSASVLFVLIACLRTGMFLNDAHFAHVPKTILLLSVCWVVGHQKLFLGTLFWLNVSTMCCSRLEDIRKLSYSF